jgi:Domain of unknown function (DUF4907)
MKKILFVFGLALTTLAATAQMHVKDTTARHPEPTKYANSKFEWKIIDAPNNTHGYEIFVDGNKDPLIHQTNIPGMPGNDGFKTKIDAQNAAKYVITKIQKGEFPPTVTPEELKKIKVIK